MNAIVTDNMINPIRDNIGHQEELLIAIYIIVNQKYTTVIYIFHFFL
jgi:hypothetical protein